MHEKQKEKYKEVHEKEAEINQEKREDQESGNFHAMIAINAILAFGLFLATNALSTVMRILNASRVQKCSSNRIT